MLGQALPIQIDLDQERQSAVLAGHTLRAQQKAPDGRIRASFDIIWLSGWAPHESQPKPLRPGSAKASLEAAVKRAPK